MTADRLERHTMKLTGKNLLTIAAVAAVVNIAMGHLAAAQGAN